MVSLNRLRAAIGVVVLAAAAAPAGAQGGLALKAGLSYGTASNTGIAPGATQRSGFAVGVGISSGSLIGLGVDALYAQRGFTSSTAADTRRLDYIDVPVTLRVSLPTPGISPFAYAGPQGSYELQCGTGDGTCPESGRPRLTYAGIIGGGARFGALGGLSVEARYVYGLSDLKLSTVQSSASYKTRSLLLLVGIGN